MIKENLQEVRNRIEKAAQKCGRNKEEITLIAVSKTKPISLLLEAYDNGCRVFGENKVQELLEKYDAMPKDISWHMIGHLQRNKVKYIIDKVTLIHSVDSYRLAEEISKEAGKKNVTAHILIEVNMAGEETKYGAAPEEVSSLVDEISKLPYLKVEGLMTVAPFVEKAEENEYYFAKLHQLYVDITEKNIDNVTMNVLSMGMTGDYEIAIEAGATCVRVGAGIFGDRHY